MITRRKLLRSGAAAGVAGLTGLASSGSATARPTDFVERDGRHFAVGGDRYYFSGTDNFWIQDPWRDKQAVDRFFELADRLNLNVVRTWGWCSGNDNPSAHCLQPTKGEFSEAGFEHFDYVIKRAGDYGIRLVIPFTDNWGAYGGMQQYVKWSPTASSHDDFYTDANTREMYRNFVEHVLTRKNSYTGLEYREDPTVAVWELANEPRAKQAGVDALTTWIEDMSAFIKDVDGNHLVSTGMEGFYDGAHGGSGWTYDGSQGTAYLDQHRIDTIDACSFHLYPHHWNKSHEWGTTWIRQHVRDAHEKLGKPAYLGEFGVHTSGTGQSQERANVFDTWYAALAETDADAAMFWELVQKKRGNHDGFSVHIDDEPTITQIEQYTKLVREKSGSGTDSTAPAAPTGLSGEATGANALTASWNAASDTGGSGLDHYVVDVGGRSKQVPAGTTTVTVTGLSSSAPWEVAVVAVDGAGNRSKPATVTVEGSDGGLEPIVEGNVPRNVDSDPAYEDLNANGKVDFDDVVIYFDNMDRPAMTDHVDAYDYNGNGKIDFDDVVALFGEVE